MRRSEIFDNFIKIAQEKGLVSEDAPEKAKKKLESNPRADSLNIKDIEALYGVKPDMPKSMEYKKNIIEDAHPESVVISPAYDRLNGLVENNIERQNIILNIINKVPIGQLTNKRYAEQELVLSLVRLGNDLDNQNKDELMVLADTCLEQISEDQKKSLVKTALAPMLIVAIIASAFGGMYAYEHMPNISQGFKQDSARLIELVNELVSGATTWYGTGIEIADDLKNDMSKLSQDLRNFENLYDKLYPVMISIIKPQNASELLEPEIQAKAQNVARVTDILLNKFNKLKNYMTQVKSRFSNPAYKAMVTKNIGAITKFLEQTHIMGGSTALIADKFEEITNEIPTYIASVEDVIKVLNDSKTQAQTIQQSLLSSMRNKSTTFPKLNTEKDDLGIAKDEEEIKNLGIS